MSKKIFVWDSKEGKLVEKVKSTGVELPAFHRDDAPIFRRYDPQINATPGTRSEARRIGAQYGMKMQ